jgi:hypothetical protein
VSQHPVQVPTFLMVRAIVGAALTFNIEFAENTEAAEAVRWITLLELQRLIP